MSHTPVEVVPVLAVSQHPNADRLELVQVLNTQFVAQKGGFVVGDLCVYFPPDVLIPESLAEQLGVATYLKHSVYPGDSFKSQCRVGAIRLRGVASFGFALPIAKVRDLCPATCFDVGSDLSAVLLAMKYQPPELETIRGSDSLREPEAFHRYTSIEHYYRNADALLEGEPVRITEKIHGCVVSDTRIRMADGSSKYIRNIEPGDMVAGFQDGKIVPSKVLKVWQNGPVDDWLKIKFPRNRAGRGSSFGVVTCTPNHRFLQPDGSYVEASKLSTGDTVALLRSDWHLSHVQEQVILGKLLGDGSLAAGSCSHHLAFGHTELELVEWTCRGLGDLASDKRDTQMSGYGSLMHRACTHNSVFVSTKFGDFIREGRKVVPTWVADELTPLAIAFWYMDDGSLGHHGNQEDRAHFAVCGFTQEDCAVLQAGLRRYGINSIYYTAEGYSRLRLNADNAERLFLLIAPYIPPNLQYKLPERYTGHPGWLPDPGVSYKEEIVWQAIQSIEPVTPRSKQRWDLETTTHNYLPSSVVTHNSNSRVGLIYDNGWEFMCGSHRRRVKQENARGQRSIYWKPLSPEMMDLLTDLSMEMRNVIVFGEIFGRKVQQMDYGVAPAEGYRVFDISLNGQYMDWHDICTVCDRYGIPVVPLLYSGPFYPHKIDELGRGPTTIARPDDIACKFKGREGVVITPLTETFSPRLGGRLILKAVSPDYYEAMQ